MMMRAIRKAGSLSFTRSRRACRAEHRKSWQAAQLAGKQGLNTTLGAYNVRRKLGDLHWDLLFLYKCNRFGDEGSLHRYIHLIPNLRDDEIKIPQLMTIANYLGIASLHFAHD